MAANRIKSDRGSSNNRQWLYIGGGAAVLLIIVIVIVMSLPRGANIQASGTTSGSGNVANATELMTPGPLGDITLGDPKAPNVLIEYASLTCPHCQAWNAQVYPALKTKYVDTGKVYYIVREFPRDAADVMAFMIVRCFPERALPLMDLMFSQQGYWVSSQPGEYQARLQSLVKQAGISQDQFNACVANQDILTAVAGAQTKATKSFNVGATPTFFLNGVKLEGEQPLANLEKKFVAPTS